VKFVEYIRQSIQILIKKDRKIERLREGKIERLREGKIKRLREGKIERLISKIID
jgi:hypothetical protein